MSARPCPMCGNLRKCYQTMSGEGWHQPACWACGAPGFVEPADFPGPSDGAQPSALGLVEGIMPGIVARARARQDVVHPWGSGGYLAQSDLDALVKTVGNLDVMAGLIKSAAETLGHSVRFEGTWADCACGDWSVRADEAPNGHHGPYLAHLALVMIEEAKR